eukprot:1479972-Amphidinium_carterae.1
MDRGRTNSTMRLMFQPAVNLVVIWPRFWNYITCRLGAVQRIEGYSERVGVCVSLSTAGAHVSLP